MSVPDIHKADIGTALVVAMVDETGAAIDVSTATTKQIWLGKPNSPDATVLTKTAVNDTTGADGKIKYVTVSGDLSNAGEWSIQGYVVVAGKEWHSVVSKFQVAQNLQ